MNATRGAADGGTAGNGGALSRLWSGAVRDNSGSSFLAATAPGFLLAGSIFAKPITGRDSAFAALRVSSGIYDSLKFTHELLGQGRAYLEWEGLALGEEISGVTIITLEENGQISRAVIHSQPLGAVLAFSGEMRKRLTKVIDARHFLAELL